MYILNLQRSLLLSTFLLLVLDMLPAQILPVSHILPDAVRGQAYNGKVDFDLPGGDPAGVSYTWEVQQGGINVNMTNRTGLGLAADGTIINDVDPGATLGVYELYLTASMGGAEQARDTFKLVVRPDDQSDCGNYKIALVLDASGSMNAATPAGSTRWLDLQRAVTTYLPSLSNWVAPEDELQVIHFQGGVAGPVTYNTTYNFSDFNWSEEADIRSKIFGSAIAGGGTPLGAGVDVADFSLSPDRQAIILFTDGRENMSPLIYPSAPDYTILGIPVSSDDLFYPIGVAGCDEPLLNELASEGSGNGHSGFTFHTSDLDVLFQSTIPQFFNSCSPRMVTYRSGTLQGPSQPVVESFYVDSLVRKISVVLKCRERSCRFENPVLRLNGQSVGLPRLGTPGEVHYALDLPLINSDGTMAIDGGGQWSLSVGGLANSEYSLLVIVDDKYVNQELRIPNAPIYAGDRIEVSAMLDFVGQPLDDLEVQAYLFKPGEDPGELFATSSYTPSGDPVETIIAPGLNQSSILAQAKINDLLVDPAILERLRLRERRIDLIPAGNGRYQGAFLASETDASSHYKVVVTYEGRVPGIDSLQGMLIEHVMVNFARPLDIDLNQRINYTSINTQDGGSKYSIQLRPVNKVGNLLGPGHAQHISTQFNGDRIVLTDNLDGTYTGFYNTSSEGAEVSVYVLDGKQPVLKRKLGKRWGLSVHAGSLATANSTPPFNRIDGDLYYEADLTYRFSSHWEIEALVGLNTFTNDFEIYEGGLYGTYRFTGSPIGPLLTPYLKAGVSYFQADTFAGELGGGARLGVSLNIGSRLEASVEYGGSYLLDSELAFTKVGGGLKFFF